MLLRLPDELPDTRDDDSQNQGVQRNDEHDEVRVIVLADTRPQPNAVMIELAHAVVAQVTVGRLRGPEDQTRLTEFHCGECRVTEVRPVGGLALIYVVKDALALVIDVNVL